MIVYSVGVMAQCKDIDERGNENVFISHSILGTYKLNTLRCWPCCHRTKNVRREGCLRRRPGSVVRSFIVKQLVHLIVVQIRWLAFIIV